MKTKRYIEVIDHLIDRLVQAEVENKRLLSVCAKTGCNHIWLRLNGFTEGVVLNVCAHCNEIRWTRPEDEG